MKKIIYLLPILIYITVTLIHQKTYHQTPLKKMNLKIIFAKDKDLGEKPVKDTRVPSKVTREKTPVSQEDAIKYIHNGYQRVFGGDPTPKQLAILVAQSAFETGWWKEMYNYNYGNIKGMGPSGLTTYLPTTEGYGKTKVSIIDGFRAYSDPFEGIDDYLELLRDKYPRATECMKKEDVDGFINELQGSYFTGNPGAYKSAVNKIVKQLAPQTSAVTSKSKPSPSPSASAAKTKSSKNKKKADDVLALADRFQKLALR